MRGFCSRCKEFRSDNGVDAWPIVWKNRMGVCGKCGGYIDLWNGNNHNRTDNRHKLWAAAQRVRSTTYPLIPVSRTKGSRSVR